MVERARLLERAAAIGLGQLESIDWHLERRREVSAWYRERLTGTPGLTWQIAQPWARHVWWMFTIVLDRALPVTRDTVKDRLAQQNIETRSVPYPLHQLPIYQDATRDLFPVADHISARGINLPTWSKVTKADVDEICDIVVDAVAHAGEDKP